MPTKIAPPSHARHRPDDSKHPRSSRELFVRTKRRFSPRPESTGRIKTEDGVDAAALTTAADSLSDLKQHGVRLHHVALAIETCRPLDISSCFGKLMISEDALITIDV